MVIHPDHVTELRKQVAEAERVLASRRLLLEFAEGNLPIPGKSSAALTSVFFPQQAEFRHSEPGMTGVEWTPPLFDPPPSRLAFQTQDGRFDPAHWSSGLGYARGGAAGAHPYPVEPLPPIGVGQDVEQAPFPEDGSAPRMDAETLAALQRYQEAHNDQDRAEGVTPLPSAEGGES